MRHNIRILKALQYSAIYTPYNNSFNSSTSCEGNDIIFLHTEVVEHRSLSQILILRMCKPNVEDIAMHQSDDSKYATCGIIYDDSTDQRIIATYRIIKCNNLDIYFSSMYFTQLKQKTTDRLYDTCGKNELIALATSVAQNHQEYQNQFGPIPHHTVRGKNIIFALTTLSFLTGSATTIYGYTKSQHKFTIAGASVILATIIIMTITQCLSCTQTRISSPHATDGISVQNNSLASQQPTISSPSP